ncbi:MAG TPA: hypothetical protein VFL42_03515, partial [Terriglobales bacterium]|nr:hypothetical protein [Terriglobales bacterium]
VMVEMVLRLPISISPEQAAFNASYRPREQGRTSFVDPDPQPQTANRRQQRQTRPSTVPFLLPFF